MVNLFAYIQIPYLILIVITFVLLLTSFLAIFFGIDWYNWIKKDKIIYFDKNMRWVIKHVKTRGKETIKEGKGTYHLSDKATYLNEKGKSLALFQLNKPQPLQIRPNTIEWLDSDSLTAVINNEQVRKIITPKNPVLDKLLILGSIAGIIAGIAGLLIMAKVYGVIQ